MNETNEQRRALRAEIEDLKRQLEEHRSRLPRASGRIAAPPSLVLMALRAGGL